MTNITLSAKVHLVKAMVFPVVMYGCESWTVKKAEHWRTDAFELWCWRRLLRVPWTTRRSNQSILKEISPGCSMEGLMLKLKLQHSGHLMWRADSFGWERLRAGREGDDRGWDGWMASLTQWTWVWVNSRSWWWTGRPGVLQSMRLHKHMCVRVHTHTHTHTHIRQANREGPPSTKNMKAWKKSTIWTQLHSPLGSYVWSIRCKWEDDWRVELRTQNEWCHTATYVGPNKRFL